jgi:hypothetical protein
MAEKGYNLFPAVIQRRIYFGDAVDYLLEVPPHTATLRVVSAPSRQFEKGQKVFALAHPDHCVVVGEG